MKGDVCEVVSSNTVGIVFGVIFGVLAVAGVAVGVYMFIKKSKSASVSSYGSKN